LWTTAAMVKSKYIVCNYIIRNEGRMRRWEVKISYENSVTTAVIQADSKDEAVDE